MLAVTIALLSGRSPEESMYYRAFGSIVGIVLYGGLLYATYEFVDTIFKRKEYISSEGGSIYILHHRPIKISEISDIYLANGFFSKNIVISTGGGRKTKIKTHFLGESPNIVLERLQALTE
jgi:hypothetical protein